MTYKYCLPEFDVFFHFLNGILQSSDIVNTDEAQYIDFFYR